MRPRLPARVRISVTARVGDTSGLQGKADSTQFDCFKDMSSKNFFESMVYSRCADIGVIRRENLRLDEDGVKVLEGSGIRKDKYFTAFRKLVNEVLLEYGETNRGDWTKKLGGKDKNVSKDQNFQADMLLKFNDKVDLVSVFKDVIDKPEDDVRLVRVGSRAACFEDIVVKKGQYVYFEITETPQKVFEKLYQLILNGEVLKREWIGEEAEIAAMGIFVNGNRKNFEKATWCLREFLTRASDRNLTIFGTEKIPIFLCYTPYRNVFSSIAEINNGMTQFKDDMKTKFDAVDKKFDQINQKFDAVDKKFDQINKKFDKKFDQVNERLDQLFSLLQPILLERNKTRTD